LIDTYFNYVDKYCKEYGEKTVVLMQVGAFYEVYGKKHNSLKNIVGSKIEDFCKICELNIANKSKVTSNFTFINKNGFEETIKCNIVMAGFRDYIIEKYIDKMNKAGFTTVVYKQNDEVPSAPRELVAINTPGTYFKEENEKLSNSIMCVYLLHKKPSKFISNNSYYYGISNIDILTGYSNVSEYNEKYFKSLTTFDELEKYITIYNPNEFIIIFDDVNVEKTKIESIIKYIGVHSKVIRYINLNNTENPLSIRANNCNEQTRQNEIIKKFYIDKPEEYEFILSSLYEYNCALFSFTFLLDFIHNSNPDLIKKIKAPEINKHSEQLILANHSLKQLNIVSNNNESKGKFSCLMNFINNCVTPMGKRYLNNSISKPSTNISYLNNEYNKIQYILDNFNRYEFIRGEFYNMKDIESLYRKIALNKATPYDIYLLKNTLLKCKKVFENIKNYDNTLLFDSDNYQKSYKLLDDFIDKYINIEVCSKLSNDFYQFNFFNREIFVELDNYERNSLECFNKLEAIQYFLSNEMKSCEKNPKQTLYCKLHETEKSGYFLKATETRAKKLIDSFQKKDYNNYQLSYISSFDNKEYKFDFNIKNIKKEKKGSDMYIKSNQIIDICESIEYNKNEMKQLLKKHFKNFLNELLIYQDEFYDIISFIVSLDTCISKAYFSKKYRYCKPIIDEESDESYINAKQLRHSLIEQINTEELYVPNDVYLDQNSNGILLYGTNAVGKSSLIKSIGISVILAQSGFFVPCKKFVYKPFQYIFTRILGNDNIFKGLSTFAVEMSELRTILRLSNKNSLILGDELCSGTELGSAISIFLAGLIKLHQNNSKFIFATHFHEITKMDELKKLDKLRLMHMSVYYNNEIDCLVYDRKLKEGPGNNMYGLEVCKSLNLPQDFIDLALSIRENNNDNLKPLSLQKKSKYNAKKIIGNCEHCGEKSTEVHHLQHQKEADEDNIIDYFHKNHKSNLMNVCEKCHLYFHKSEKQYKRVKTTNGYMILEK